MRNEEDQEHSKYPNNVKHNSIHMVNYVGSGKVCSVLSNFVYQYIKLCSIYIAMLQNVIPIESGFNSSLVFRKRKISSK